MTREAWAQRSGVPATPQALNRYAYARNNPLRWTDPTRHWIESALDIAFIAYDLYDISQNGLTWENGLALAANVGGLILPGLTGGGALVRAVAHADDVADAAQAATRVDDVVDPLKQRADELHRLLDSYAQDRRTTAIVRGERDGQQIDIVASSNPRLDPRQRAALRPGEIEAYGEGYAEVTALEYARQHGITPQQVAASHPICPACAQRIAESGARPVNPLRKTSGIKEE
ncbi:MAG: hypothetical protein RMJ55_15850 [Roseiflexaceae bacterium]|nr:hypothetical protein [Roseiflexaceae bacterium]